MPSAEGRINAVAGDSNAPIYTAIKLVRHHQDDPASYRDNVLIRWSRRILPSPTTSTAPN